MALVEPVVRFLQGHDPTLALRIAGCKFLPEGPRFAPLRAHEEQLQRAGGVQLQLLGIGRTGHIGFNEPGSSRRSGTRFIHLDGRAHGNPPNPYYLGESIGHWEGDALVVDTTGFVDGTLFQIGRDRRALLQGDPNPTAGVIFGKHGPDMHLVERLGQQLLEGVDGIVISPGDEQPAEAAQRAARGHSEDLRLTNGPVEQALAQPSEQPR